MKNKKYLIGLLALSLLTACGNKENNANSETGTDNKETENSTSEASNITNEVSKEIFDSKLFLHYQKYRGEKKNIYFSGGEKGTVYITVVDEEKVKDENGGPSTDKIVSGEILEQGTYEFEGDDVILSMPGYKPTRCYFEKRDDSSSYWERSYNLWLSYGYDQEDEDGETKEGYYDCYEKFGLMKFYYSETSDLIKEYFNIAD